MTHYRTLFAFFLLCSVIFTWPLAIESSTSLPQGTESGGTVPAFNLWTMKWNEASLKNFYFGYWNAPIFYPNNDSFALSEPQPITGVIFTILKLLTQSDSMAYGFLIILFFTLNALATTFLLRTWGLDKGPSCLGGALMMCIPFVSNEIGVLQLIPIFPFITSITLFYILCKDPSRKNSILFGASFAATVLFSTYYGIYLSIFILLAVPFFFKFSSLNKEKFTNLALGAAVSIIALAPTVSVQLMMSSKYSRSTNIIKRTSANFTDYIRLHQNHWGYDLMPWLDTAQTGAQRLYPGTLYILLAIVALIFARKVFPQRVFFYCISSVALAFFLSIGLNLEIGDFQPYELIRQNYPGLKQLRSPFRFAVVMQIFVVVLASAGLHKIWNWKQPMSINASIILAAIALSEVMIAPISLYRLPKDLLDQPWISALKEMEDGPVAMIPFPKSGRAQDYEDTTLQMLQAFEHGKPIINGYSGYYPKTYTDLIPSMTRFPNNRAFSELQNLGTRYIVLDWKWIESYGGNIYPFLRRFEMKHSGPKALIYEIQPKR